MENSRLQEAAPTDIVQTHLLDVHENRVPRCILHIANGAIACGPWVASFRP